MMEKLSDQVLAAKLRHCCNLGDSECETCPGADICADWPAEIMLAAAERIELLSRRLDEAAGLAMELQGRLDKVAELAEAMAGEPSGADARNGGDPAPTAEGAAGPSPTVPQSAPDGFPALHHGEGAGQCR